MIVITGANRSGTSMTTHLLAELGLDLGPPELLLGPDYRNPKGYFENKEILFANIRLLLGGWVSPTNWADEIERQRPTLPTRLMMLAAKGRYFLATPAGVARRARKHDAELTRLFAKYDDVAVNDARFSSTLGAWKRHGRISKVLYCYRHPADVAESMRRAYGLPPWAGMLFWNQRVGDFLSLIGDIPFAMVRYENFFDPAQRAAEVRRLCDFIGRPYAEDAVAGVVNRIIDPGLKHHSAPASARLPGYARRRYEQLNQLHAVHAQARCL